MTSADISGFFQNFDEVKDPESAVEIEGRIPTELNGSFYSVAPGIWDLSKCTLKSYMDGYGMISKFEITDGQIKMMKRFAQSEAYKMAIMNGEPKFTEFATRSPEEKKKGFMSKLMMTMAMSDLSDNCSASLFKFGDHLFASSASCYFYEIDGKNLETGSRLDAKKLYGQNGFSTHPLEDDSGILWNMGFSVMPMVKYNIVKITKPQSNGEVIGNGKVVCSISPRWTGALALNHSFGISENHIIFIEQPYAILVSKVLQASTKGYPVCEWLEWRPNETNIFHLVNKSTGKLLPVKIQSHEAFFFMHIVNCFEEDGKIIVDVITSENPNSIHALNLENLRNNSVGIEVPKNRLHRYILPTTKTASNDPAFVEFDSKKSMFIVKPMELASIPGSIDKFCINPKFRGKKYRYAYIVGSFLHNNAFDKLPHSVCKLDLESKTICWSWSGSSGVNALDSTIFPDEPQFFASTGSEVSSLAEDDGFVMCPISCCPGGTNNTQFVILNSASGDLLCKASFSQRFPTGIHSLYVPQSG